MQYFLICSHELMPAVFLNLVSPWLDKVSASKHGSQAFAQRIFAFMFSQSLHSAILAFDQRLYMLLSDDCLSLCKGEETGRQVMGYCPNGDIRRSGVGRGRLIQCHSAGKVPGPILPEWNEFEAGGIQSMIMLTTNVSSQEASFSRRSFPEDLTNPQGLHIICHAQDSRPGQMNPIPAVSS